MMAITKYARTVHTGSDPQRQPGQPEAAHRSPPHPAVMNPCLCIVAIMLEQQLHLPGTCTVVQHSTTVNTQVVGLVDHQR